MLKQRHAAKGGAEICRMLNSMESGRTMVEQWLWTQTINLIFDATDSFILLDRLRNVAEYRRIETAQNKKKSFQFATDTRADERRRIK